MAGTKARDAEPGAPSDKPQGYYDADQQGNAVYVLQRAQREGRDKPGTYLLLQQITYVSKAGRAWTVPGRKGQRFETDLASIPTLASWLVPKDGSHTPAALIHDAMVLGKDEQPCYKPRSPRVSREQADDLFREGMQLLGVRFVRRWLMWAAVSIPTLFERKEGEDGASCWVRRALLAPLAAFIVIGLFGVPDVFDVPGSRTVWSWLPLVGGNVVTWNLFGIAEGSLARELLSFLTVAAIAAVAYAILWLRRWRFGFTVGLGLALVTFVMVLTGLTYLAYQALETLIGLVLRRRQTRAAARDPKVAALPVGPQGPAQEYVPEWVGQLAKKL